MMRLSRSGSISLNHSGAGRRGDRMRRRDFMGQTTPPAYCADADLSNSWTPQSGTGFARDRQQHSGDLSIFAQRQLTVMTYAQPGERRVNRVKESVKTHLDRWPLLAKRILLRRGKHLAACSCCSIECGSVGATAASVIMRPLIPTKLRVHDRSIINDVTRGHPNSLAILVGLIFWVVSFLWASSSLYQLVFDR